MQYEMSQSLPYRLHDSHFRSRPFCHLPGFPTASHTDQQTAQYPVHVWGYAEHQLQINKSSNIRTKRIGDGFQRYWSYMIELDMQQKPEKTKAEKGEWGKWK